MVRSLSSNSNMGQEATPLLSNFYTVDQGTQNVIVYRVTRFLTMLKIIYAVLLVKLAAIAVYVGVNYTMVLGHSADIVPMIAVAGVLLFVCLLALIFFQMASGHQKVAAELFEHRHIGSWVYDPVTWPILAKRKFHQLLSSVFIVILCTGITYATVTLVFWYANNLREDIIVRVSSFGIFAAVLFTITLIFGLVRRHARFDPATHSCTLARGAIYFEGNLYCLKPFTPKFYSHPILACALTQEFMEGRALNILKLKLAHFGVLSRVEIPVPDEKVHEVGQWLQVFQNPTMVYHHVPAPMQQDTVTITHIDQATSTYCPV
ncbi:hypothetical protein PROFUN_03448 [Planoprotostelium fungivorum]|uniref:Uncharacterized protein n=1 Tax=Planoprotostelium fungivorum TaxID=1890364 RepID=A0A2P6MN45_9EUKA|nr:hypothetical protein PROFUN_03448 [Planoprotostelium fungivorum]